VAAFKSEIEKQGLSNDVEVRGTGVMASARRVPSSSSGLRRHAICSDSARCTEIISTSLKDKKIVDRLLYVDPATGESVSTESRYRFTSTRSGSFSAPTGRSIPRLRLPRHWWVPGPGQSAVRDDAQQVISEVKESA